MAEYSIFMKHPSNKWMENIIINCICFSRSGTGKILEPPCNLHFLNKYRHKSKMANCSAVKRECLGTCPHCTSHRRTKAYAHAVGFLNSYLIGHTILPLILQFFQQKYMTINMIVNHYNCVITSIRVGLVHRWLPQCGNIPLQTLISCWTLLTARWHDPQKTSCQFKEWKGL